MYRTMLKTSRVFIMSLLAAFLLIPACPTLAWVDAGHKIVAMIAWEELTPAAKAAIIQTLKAHPQFEKDLLNERPATTAPTTQIIPDGLVEPMPDAADRHIFATAAIWPDMIRLQSHPMRAAYNHPYWHYISLPVVVDNQPVPPEKITDSAPPHNVVEALDKCVADLKDPAVSASDKAIALCWIEHLVGDIHQPLHAARLISPQFPTGDQGGNLITLLRDPPYPNSSMNLHLIWDSLPGQFKSEDFDRYEADGLRNDPRFSREKLKDLLAVTDFMSWAKESNALAAHYAYLDGKLKGAATTRESRDGQASRDARSSPRDDIPGVPPGYIAQAESVALRQLALAGHRLADLLNALYAGK
jgi:hypothetical protein